LSVRLDKTASKILTARKPSKKLSYSDLSPIKIEKYENSNRKNTNESLFAEDYSFCKKEKSKVSNLSKLFGNSDDSYNLKKNFFRNSVRSSFIKKII
jgi:hypothetical protein